MTFETKLAFHPDAAENFRAQGEKLFVSLRPLERSQPKERFEAQRHPAETWTKEDLPPRILQETVDRLTMEVTEIAFLAQEESLALTGDDCHALATLTEAMQGTTDFKPRISRDFVRRTILRWLEEKIDATTDYDLPTYLLKKAAEALDTFEVWVPIANLAVEREVRLGPALVKPLSKELLDAWFDSWKAAKPTSDHALLTEVFEKLRRRIQGLAASVIMLRAEPQFAVEKGLEKAEEVAAVFRLLHPANESPQAVFYCRPLGRENVETHLALVAKDGIIEERIEGTSPPMPSIWELSEEELNLLEYDFIRIRKLLQVAGRSDFAKATLEAILLYARSTMSREATDKLVFIFTAIESILLKNATEPVQSNVGDRLAFLLGSSQEERKRITRLVRTAYDFRSRFVHHGKRSLADLAHLKEFLQYAWIFFLRLPHLAERYQRREDFIEAIDNRKYA